jgi:hypothetical protein
MQSVDKARIKLEHWITHNDSHRDEYERFARELEEMGKTESASHVRALVDLADKSKDCLHKALRALES